MKKPLVAIVGPTAVGKTALSLQLAHTLNGEILSCDSMQIYQGMDIGTAKATPEERAAVPHHLLDICRPEMNFSAADYQKKAMDAIEDVLQRGHLPILVGGTGLFYQAVVDQYDFAPELKSPELREKWQQLFEEKGWDYIREELRRKDPVYLEKIGSHDVRRALRALEVYEACGHPFSELMRRETDGWKLAVVGFYMPRAQLYQRINLRVEQMLQQGLIEEVTALRKQGLSYEHQSMQAIGYKQVLYYLDGWMTRTQLIHEMQRDSRNYAKRQYTWFKKDRRIFWVNTGSGITLSCLADFIGSYISGRLTFD